MDQLKHIAYHEAGHAVVAFLLGRDLKLLQIKSKDDGSLPCDMDSAAPIEKAMVYLAGKGAELAFFHQALPDRNADDCNKACILRLSLAPYQDRMIDFKISRMIFDSAPTIMSLAEKLLEAKVMRSDMVRRAILSAIMADRLAAGTREPLLGTGAYGMEAGRACPSTVDDG